MQSINQFLDDKFNFSDRKNKKAAYCVIVRTKGSTPRKVGSKMIVFEDGEIEGSIGGGNLEKKVIENAINQIKKQEPNLFKHDLLHQHNMCCGGIVEIYIEPIIKMNRLYIFGAGHTGNALANFASRLNFDIFIIDDREQYLNNIDNKEINKLNLDYKNVLPSLPFDENTYIVIMTYDHSHDRNILAYCLKKPRAYLGMIGSKRKISLTKKMFLEGNIATEEELEQVDMPMGLKIKAESPDEIAISLLAKLISIKNG
jgi:xanthine dehydrogenase accessory factor